MLDSLQQCQTLLKELSQGIYFQLADGKPLDVNPAALELFGMEREEFLAHTDEQPQWRLTSSDGEELPLSQHPALRALMTAAPVRGTTVGIITPRRDTPVWVKMEAFPLFDDSGLTPARVCVVLQDQSEQKRVERQEHQAARRYELMVSSSMDGFWITDMEGKILSVNDAACAMYGYSREEITGMNVAQFEAREELDEVLKHTEKIMTQRYDRFESVHRRKDGSLVEVEVSATFIPESGIYLAFLQDITSKKSAERALLESERRYKAVVESQLEFVDRYLPGGVLTFVNDALCRYFDASRDELLGNSFFPFVHPDDLEQLVRGLDSIDAAHPYFEVENRVFLKDGSMRWHQWSHYALCDEEGRVCEYQSVGRDITERKRVEDELRESEKRYKAIVQTQAEFVVRYRHGGMLTFVNDTFCDYTQKSRDELMGMSFYQFFFLQDREALTSSVESMETEHQAEVLEVRAWLPDGRLVWQKWSNSPIVNEAGEVVEFQATGMDITRSKQAEESLKKSEERYRSLFDNMLNGFALCQMVLDPEHPLDFIFLEVNKSFERLTGLKGVKGKRMSDLIPAVAQSDRELLSLFRRVALTGQPEQLEYFFSAINEWLSISVYSPEPGCFVAVFDAITKKKRTEECLAFLAQACSNVTAEETFFHRLARYLAKALDMDFICIDLLEEGNEFARTLAVYYDGSFEPNMRYHLRNTPCREVVDQSICYFREGVRQLYPSDQMLQDIGAESYLGTVLHSSSGAAIGLIAAIGKKPLGNAELAKEILQMVSARAAAEIERGMHEEERLRLEQQLLHAQKLESLGILAGGIAHDFNNILTGILGNSSLGLLRIDPASPAVENLQNIEKSAVRAADLAKQMLAYSGKGMFVVEPISLNLLLEEMIKLLEVSVSKKAQLKLRLAQELPAVQGDPTQLRQIVMNLVINASEAIGEQGGEIAIATGFRHFDRHALKNTWFDGELPQGEYIFLQVSDTGCGMDEKTLSRIFDPFFTTKFTGRGLGMSAVLGIIRGHKGAIKVQSRKGRGTTFTILLPPSELPLPKRPTGEKEKSWSGSGTVLLVDDEESICEIGGSMLGQLGYRVVTAQSGEAALRLYRERKDISFVILDLTMPQMDGEQTFQGLREIDPEVKVIMSSGYSEQEVTKRFGGDRPLDFIQKPYDVQALQEVMQRWDDSAVDPQGT